VSCAVDQNLNQDHHFGSKASESQPEVLHGTVSGGSFSSRSNAPAGNGFGELSEKVRPSPVFLGVLAAFIGSGVWAWFVEGRWPVRAFVVSGWIVSLCLHEFGHAATAFVGGDRSVASKGYLTLDPRKYAHLGLSLALPVLFLLIGGIGLPGGAVWINRGAIRSRKMMSLMSLAGPFANFIVAAVLAIPFVLGFGAVQLIDGFNIVSHLSFFGALAFLAVLQIGTGLLNLLPVPGLDGFGAIEPHLPEEILRSVAKVRQFTTLFLLLIFFNTNLGRYLWMGADEIAGWMNVPIGLSDWGQAAFSFSR
jgi:Zn-dependent protease